MPPFPLHLESLVGQYGSYLIFLLIGFFFGYVLEIAGFGNSQKLANQFYLKDMTVLKVMFTAIVVAMVLIFGASALNLLDINLIWVNPTYLIPGIVGGLIMGVGFIIGGFCPGTSVVAMATWKIDGLFYVLGTLFGIFLFGETVDNFSAFWNSTYMGRFMLPEWLGVDTGLVVVGVVLMAIGMFGGAEQLERIFGKKDLKAEPRTRFVGAGALAGLALVVALIGQPTTKDRWQAVSSVKEAALAERQVQIEPGELLNLLHDHELKPILLDVRDEADYNLFHLERAIHMPPETLPERLEEFQLEGPTTVFVVMSNDELGATEVWKTLVAESVPNVYILAGGVNGWLDVFAAEDVRIQPADPGKPDALRYTFAAALGSNYPSADPDPGEYELEYPARIKLELKRGPTGGGCG
jgi:hypothetical protein